MITLQKYTPDTLNELAVFLSSHPWPFHGGDSASVDDIKQSAAKGYYTREHIECFWIVNDRAEKLGFIRLFDLEDPTPMFDIRTDPNTQKKGVGTAALMALCDHVFTLPDVTRFEGHTRVDNWAMRKVFLKCGFLKEAHHRGAWPDEATGKDYDSVGYGLTKSDWESKSVTPFKWADEPKVNPQW